MGSHRLSGFLGFLRSLARRWAGAAPDPSPDAIGGPPVPEIDDGWIVAFVWPRGRATGADLEALGRELVAWMSRHPRVFRIGGLESLLAGQYPPPYGTTAYVESPEGEIKAVPRFVGGQLVIESRRLAVVDPWLYCPALVCARAGMSADEAIESLKRELPPGLVSCVGPYID